MQNQIPPENRIRFMDRDYNIPTWVNNRQHIVNIAWKMEDGQTFDELTTDEKQTLLKLLDDLEQQRGRINLDEEYEDVYRLTIALMRRSIVNRNAAIARMPSTPRQKGGNLKKTKECIMIQNRKYCIYVGPRGGQYIKKNGEFSYLKK